MKDVTPASSSCSDSDQITAITIDAIGQIDIAALISDLDGTPLKLTANAAETLKLKAGEPLAAHREILDQILDPQLLHKPDSDPRAALRPTNVRELELLTSAGRSFKALAYTKRVRLNTDDDEIREILVSVFHDLTYLEPFFWTIEQSR